MEVVVTETDNDEAQGTARCDIALREDRVLSAPDAGQVQRLDRSIDQSRRRPIDALMIGQTGSRKRGLSRARTDEPGTLHCYCCSLSAASSASILVSFSLSCAM